MSLPDVLVTDEAINEEGLPIHFSSVVARMIKNPLTNILLSVDFLRRECVDKDLKIYLETIKKNSERISHIVNELLRFNELNVFKPEKHCVQGLIEDVLVASANRLKRENIAVIKKYEAKDELFAFNYHQLVMALKNLVDNAIDSMPAENAQLTIITKSKNGNYCLVIQDNGCGIKHANLKYIFKTFFSTKGGMGLGLAAAYSIFKSNNVGITLNSELGTGTIVTLGFCKDASL